MFNLANNFYKKNETTESLKIVKQLIRNISKKENINNIQIIEIIYDLYHKNKTSIQILDLVLENPFLLLHQKDEFLRVFSILQKTRFAFSKFIRIIKYKKANIYNNTDLFGDSFNNNHITIFENNTKYVFQLKEIINIMNTALTNSPHFFSDPYASKNPYTNIPFKKSSLYNMYFAIKNSTFIMPILIQQYFLSNFDITQYTYENEYLIRNHYLECYSKNITITNVKYIVKSMLEDCNIPLNIHRNFPKDRLLEIMRPYLNLYYKAKYSLLSSEHRHYIIRLTMKLIEFIRYNPKFGRKQIIRNKNKIIREANGYTVTYNEKHIHFDEDVKIDIFMKSHLLNVPPQYMEIQYNMSETTYDNSSESTNENSDD